MARLRCTLDRGCVALVLLLLPARELKAARTQRWRAISRWALEKSRHRAQAFTPGGQFTAPPGRRIRCNSSTASAIWGQMAAPSASPLPASTAVLAAA